ncbi:MAG TPA: MFS transporter, partial [Devosia sp.]|nr:MFS transporter [Devosia sp.]
VGAAWMMTTITDSQNMVALVQGAVTLPVMIFSLAAGTLADNFDRRRIMLTAQVLMMLISFCLSAFAMMGLLNPWLLLAFTFVIGAGGALHNPSWQASMGDIVPRADLPAAVTLNSVGFNLMRSVGPALGGIIVAVGGASAAFGLNAISYLPLIGALFRWKPTLPPRNLPRENFGNAVSAGLRYVAMSPNLMTVMARAFLFGLGAVSILALLPLVSTEFLRGGPTTYGSLLGCFGAGAICGAFLNGRVRDLASNETIVRLACIGFALSCIALAFSRHIGISCLLLLPAGACWVLALSLFNVTIQLSTPRWVVGRALSLYQTATFGGMAGGSWLWGATADAYGLAWGLIGGGIVLLVAAVIGFLFTLPEFGALNLDPLDEFSAPELRLDLRPRSGPIVIMVDFNIDQADVPAFLAAMARRRRIRIRDGARQWALLRDLGNPQIWTETYHVPTWVEYLRHHQRRTHADAEVNEALLALHRGEGRPVVRRTIERQTVPLRDDTPIKDYPDIP